MDTYKIKDVLESEKQELFNVVSLFAGCGGSSTGYRLAGGRVLAINEFVKEARRVYRHNYKDTIIFEDDIRKLTGEKILRRLGLKRGELDILDGSPPCASFSAAGEREKGWGKEKQYSDKVQRTDDLFFEYARLIEEVKPKVFVAENVKGLTMGVASKLLGNGQFDAFGQHEDTIFHTLSNKGYNVRARVLNAKYYDVPQSRERLFIIGVRKDIEFVYHYPPESKRVITVREALKGVINSEKDLKEAGHNEGTKVLNVLRKMKEGEYGDKYTNGQGYFQLHRLRRDQPCPTITAQQGSKRSVINHWEEDRELSVPELVRLSSFPEDFYTGEKYRKRCERIGRAVPPLLMKAIATSIYNTILKPYFELNRKEVEEEVFIPNQLDLFA